MQKSKSRAVLRMESGGDGGSVGGAAGGESDVQSVTSSESEDKYAWAKGDGCVFFNFSHCGAFLTVRFESNL